MFKLLQFKINIYSGKIKMKMLPEAQWKITANAHRFILADKYSIKREKFHLISHLSHLNLNTI